MLMDLQLLRTLSFEVYDIDREVDDKKRYEMQIDQWFPFAIKLFSFDHVRPPYPLNWHERLEMFIPLAGKGKFVTGDDRVPFSAGDVLVVDNLKLHGLGDFCGKRRQAMVISFLPELVCTLGSPRCDSLFLSPFYRDASSPLVIVKSSDRMANPLHEALSRLVECYFSVSPRPQFQAGCKAWLLTALYYVGAHAGWTVAARSDDLRRQEQSRQLGKLNDYLLTHFCERVSIHTAASIVGMSESRFMKYFRRATGETFVSYLTRLRLQRAAQLLKETDQSIADISTEVGFCDQSYFDRMFRRHFRATPREFRGRISAGQVVAIPLRRGEAS
jgi:AraC-like DNA-binding protein